jgi:hypothetical protein
VRVVGTATALERALAAGDRTAALGALAGAEVLVRTQLVDGELRLGTIDREGETYLLLFSSPERLAGFDPAGGDYVRLPARELAASAPPGLRAVVDPGAELGLVLDADELQALAALPPPGEARLLVGAPAEPPPELLDALGELVAREPLLRAARLGQVLRRGAAGPELLVGLELEDGADPEALVARAGIPGVSFVVLGEDELSRALVAHAEPVAVE